ncbi:MAG: Tol-Pal system beta propeller repeat protein TolB [Thermodesulfobacteriota bacterium]|nr:Tol-Pal system beta propeller repeat protein TolB [Thermodesulfobacteriota bacterium]
MKKSWLIFLVALLLVGVSTEFLRAKVYIDIRSPSFRKFPIAITPFKSPLTPNEDMKLGERVTDILSNDLSISGFFALIDPKSFGESLIKPPPGVSPLPAGQRPAGTLPDSVEFRRWANIGAEALVMGEITYKDRSLTMEARLYDVVQKELIIGKRYIGEITDLSRMAHRFADEIVFALTGEQGLFQTKIVFVSKATGNKEIYVMDFDGRNVNQITRHQSICLSPRFSPDGAKVVFTSYKSGNPDIYIKNLGNGEERPISQYPGLNISPAWSPDGQRLALTLSKDGNPEIYIVNQDGSNLLRLTDNPAIDVSPAWSPDGKKIAFVSNRQGNPQIYIMDADGKNVQRLTFEGNYNTHPAWSPRGDRIAFDSSIAGGHNICTIHPDGSDFRILTANLGRCEMPSWSPDGRNLVFSSNRDGGPHIFLIDAEGTRIKKLTFHRGGDTYPNWSPRFKE